MSTLLKSGNAKSNERINEVQTSSVEQFNEEAKKARRNPFGLNEAKGNMYGFVTHTWNPLKGKCEHDCSYCYMKKRCRNLKEIHLERKELEQDLGAGHFIFVGSTTDLFAKNVKSEWIIEVLDYCNRYENRYLFQSKNPERFLEFTDHPVFQKSIVCTTIETNRFYEQFMGTAPKIEDRVLAIEMLKTECNNIVTYVTIEPVMDFDLPEMVELVKRCNPVQVSIGADSKGHNLPEPSANKVKELINELRRFTEVNEKDNLKRIMEKEFKTAKQEVATSNMMKVQIMEKTGNGYTINETNRKFGLVKENRPIKDNDVNGFLQIINSGKYDETQSIVTIEATELIEKNYNIVDLKNKPITAQEAEDYLIVLDGQHRITAFAKYNAIRTQENQVLIPNVHIKKGLENVREYLVDINMVGHHWNTADKICVSAIATNNQLLEKVNELIKEGYNASAATTICAGKRIKPTQLKKLITNGDTSHLPEATTALAKANKFITMAMGITEMTVTILTKRYFINGFISFAKAHTEDKAFEALGKLTIDDFKSVREDDDFIERLNRASQAA